MTDVRIRRFNKRYRLSGDSRSETKRLDHVLREVIDSELIESALLRAGIPATDEICIRRVSSAARLKASDPDSRIATAWSMSIADAIAESLRSGGPDVVRYGSRHHALLDMVCSVARGELSRAWAWRQLEICDAADEMTSSEAVAQIANVIARNPLVAGVLLRELARRGLLAAVLDTLQVDQLTRIANAALLAVTGKSVLDATECEPTSPDGITAAVVDRVLAKSAILRAFRWPDSNVERARAVAVLAMLECESAAAMNRASSIVAAAMGRLSALHLDPDPERTDARENQVNPLETDRGPRSGSQRRIRRLSNSEQPDRNETATGDTAESGNAARDAEPVEPRDSGKTERGGLLFLLHLMRDLDVPGLLIPGLGVGTRSTQWTLHQLALELASIDERDPAALAFAGLPPSAEPPTNDEPSASDEERAALGAIRKTLVASLRDRIGVSPGESDSAVLLRVTTRRADVVADPGWIEAHLDLSEVTTDVRRAGLDLDPGWLPMLGVVMRFIYG